MELFTLIITKDNYLEFLDPKLSIYIRAGERDYFLQQLKRLCKVIPEFTYQPTLCNQDGNWHYDNEDYWEGDVGRCSLLLYNSFFGFNDKVNKFECIRIDCESFGIELLSRGRVNKIAGVPVDYLTPAEEKRRKIEDLKQQRAQLIAEFKTLEGE